MNGLIGDLAEQHQRDLLRNAAQARRVAQARAQHPAARSHNAALAWLGVQLIGWGWRLRARYGAVEHEHTLAG